MDDERATSGEDAASRIEQAAERAEQAADRLEQAVDAVQDMVGKGGGAGSLGQGLPGYPDPDDPFPTRPTSDEALPGDPNPDDPFPSTPTGQGGSRTRGTYTDSEVDSSGE